MFQQFVSALFLFALVGAQKDPETPATAASTTTATTTTSTTTANICDSITSKKCGEALTSLDKELNATEIELDNFSSDCSVLKSCSKEALNCSTSSKSSADSLVGYCADPVTAVCASQLRRNGADLGFNMVVRTATSRGLSTEYRCEFLDRERHPYVVSGENEVSQVCGGTELKEFTEFVKRWRSAYKCKDL